ncbi:F-box protein CPR1-like isoform X2 [Punica granatum]|uniref:F-box protein CPR1-like isoform X2 n=2 Tax=Punica granatum TaxID=22663 RepID=A0A6P8DTW9_PUNGR|nr:F-box protein CPR1-like isoform X2 [Punica granatum]PKI33101.1 hypothetical protein CRG98_046510 [Punica granatum]
MDAAKLPPEVFAEILYRLTAKDLLRCRLVNKQWLSLIDDRSFIDKHLRYITGLAGAEYHNIVILRSNQKLHSMEMEPPYRVRELQPPPMRSDSEIKLVGSCNGLLCLLSSSEDFIVWNPSTNDHARLPIVPFDGITAIRSVHFAIFGFGYDSFTEDYKVVVIEPVLKQQYQDIWLYSLQRNSWRRTGDDQHQVFLHRPSRMGVYVSNTLHWVMIRNSDSNDTQVILALDLRSEDYKEVPLPLCLDNRFGMDVTVLGGCLGMVVNSPHNKVSDVWVMREYGSRESWLKLFSVPYQTADVFPFQTGFEDLYYLHRSYPAGQLLVEGANKKFHWLDAKSRSLRTFKISPPTLKEYFSGESEPFIAEVCAGSLVRVDACGGTQSVAMAAAATT